MFELMYQAWGDTIRDWQKVFIRVPSPKVARLTRFHDLFSLWLMVSGFLGRLAVIWTLAAPVEGQRAGETNDDGQQN